MRRTIIVLSLALLLILTTAQPALAATDAPDLLLNGSPLEMKAMVQDGELFLPVRAIGEALGYSVEWSSIERSAALFREQKRIKLSVETGKIISGDHERFMMDRPVLIAGRLYMRKDFFTEELSLKVQWDKGAGTVRVDSMGENPIEITTARMVSETPYLKTTIQYPVISGLTDAKIQEAINARFKGMADQAAREGAANAEALAPYIRQYPERPIQCETYFDYWIKYNQKGLMSVVFQDYQYAGGAHGGTVQTACTLDLSTGQLQGLKDLFKDGADYIPVISNSVKAQLEERKLTEALFEPLGPIRGDQAFFLKPNGVVVYYQQYEILPYAAGIQEFLVENRALAALLKAPAWFETP
jgi:inhibitor of cysteine peptidase